jgi:histidinol dehydrogenase
VSPAVTIVAASDERALAGLYAGGWDAPDDVRATVAAILDDVRARGDDAVAAYTRRFDYPDASPAALRVAIPAYDDAAAALPGDIVGGLELARRRVAAFHARQLATDERHVDADGTVNEFLVRPLGAIGAYVPGGTATLPSSVIMTVVPAKIAGVRRVVVTTPPRRDGTIDPAILFACALCEVDELFAVGGAQAIAALAYGTASIARVDKIVGPGNVWVTEAKRQVFGMCGIDGLAGPSEVLVVADANAKPEFVAGEIIAQAEHDTLARVAAVSEDRAVLERVADLLNGPFATACGRSEIVAHVLAGRTYLVHARDRTEVVRVIDRFAPEHLSLQMDDPWSLLPDVKRAGAIFVGADTPVAAGDYIAGSNHVLPTSGAARFSSGLRTADFCRTMSLIENSHIRMTSDAATLAALAEFEGLPAHARTARMRAEMDVHRR